MSDDKTVVALYELLLRHFSLDELRTLCFRLGVDFDSVEGNGKAGKARELVLLMKRQDRLLDLIEEIQLMRPNVQFAVPHDKSGSSTPVSQATDITMADVFRTAEDVTRLLTPFLKSTADVNLQNDQMKLSEQIYELILLFSQLENNDYLTQTLRRFQENPEKRQAVFQTTLMETLEESPVFLQTLADLVKAHEGDEESRPVFKTEISGGEVGQVINIDKLEGGLNINKG
jgi:hypothetical protein